MPMDKEKVHEVQDKVQETAQQALEQAHHATEAVAKSFTEWDKMRNPWCGWTRVGLGLMSPFVLWSNSILLVILLLAATITHPYWFPPYKGEATDVMTKLMDLARDWFQNTSKAEKLPIYIAGTAMGIPFACFMWMHVTFWAFFFLVAIVAYKVTFCKWLLTEYKPSTKKATAKKAPAKKTSAKAA